MFAFQALCKAATTTGVLLSALLFLTGCQQYLLAPTATASRVPPPLPYKGMTTVPFCELSQHHNQLVYVRGVYSGMDEYWAFTSPEPECEKSLFLELTLSDSVSAPLQAKLVMVHAQYNNHYLVVDAIGRYEDSLVTGYGHLGSNKAQFIVQELVGMHLVSVTGRKGNRIKAIE